MELAELILSAMISLLAPGKSVYSVVPVTDCEGECRTTKVCQEDTILCSAPFNMDGHGKKLLRFENKEEGLERYTTIAGVVAREAEAATQSGSYPGTSDELAKYAISVIYGESGFRRDVHSGKGKFARGDHGKSFCLGQILLGRDGVTEAGYKGKDLIGIDEERTTRCVGTIVQYLTRARKNCGKWATPTCVFGGYGGVTNPNKDARIGERLGILVKVSNKFKAKKK
jgi:hypothetical protein